jgi:hypothetical protein
MVKKSIKNKLFSVARDSDGIILTAENNAISSVAHSKNNSADKI